jgi:hypothetical protein
MTHQQFTVWKANRYANVSTSIRVDLCLTAAEFAELHQDPACAGKITDMANGTYRLEGVLIKVDEGQS